MLYGGIGAGGLRGNEHLKRSRNDTLYFHPPTEKEAPLNTIDLLNRILEFELAGVTHYTHYSLMVFGYSRIPIVSWMQAQPEVTLAHAREAGELITHLGGHPSLGIGLLLETHKHDIGDIHIRGSLIKKHKKDIIDQIKAVSE